MKIKFGRIKISQVVIACISSVSFCTHSIASDGGSKSTKSQVKANKNISAAAPKNMLQGQVQKEEMIEEADIFEFTPPAKKNKTTQVVPTEPDKIHRGKVDATNSQPDDSGLQPFSPNVPTMLPSNPNSQSIEPEILPFEPPLKPQSGQFDNYPKQQIPRSVPPKIQSGPWGVPSGSWGVQSGSWGVQSGPWGVKSGSWHVQSGPWGVKSGSWGVKSGTWRVAPGPWGIR
jgi:hypothetical protein